MTTPKPERTRCFLCRKPAEKPRFGGQPVCPKCERDIEKAKEEGQQPGIPPVKQT